MQVNTVFFYCARTVAHARRIVFFLHGTVINRLSSCYFLKILHALYTQIINHQSMGKQINFHFSNHARTEGALQGGLLKPFYYSSALRRNIHLTLIPSSLCIKWDCSPKAAGSSTGSCAVPDSRKRKTSSAVETHLCGKTTLFWWISLSWNFSGRTFVSIYIRCTPILL